VFLDPRLQPTIREIIDFRLKRGGNDCQISILPVAKLASKRLGYKFKGGMRKAMCQAVFRVLEQYDIELCGYRSRNYQIRDKKNMPLSLRIYQVRR